MHIYKQILLLLFVPVVFSCGTNHVLGVPKLEFKEKMVNQDYEFLKDVDYLKSGIMEINRLGEGASYYMSFVYSNIGMRLFTNKLLYQEIKNNNPMFREKALILLLRNLLQERDYVKVEIYALEYMEEHKSYDPQISKLLIESIYWQKRDEQVVAYIDNLDRTLFSDYDNYELDLLRSVSSARLGFPNWADSFRALFFNQPPSPILVRAYSFIGVNIEYKSFFSQKEIMFFEAMSLASSEDYRGAQRVLSSLMTTENWLFDTTQAIRNISRIIKSSGIITINLPGFRRSLENAPPERYFDGLVSYASLFFEVNRYSDTVSVLEGEIEKMPLGTTRDDAIYLYLLSLSHVQTETVVSKLEQYKGYLDSISYKDVIFEHVTTALVQNKDWDSLLRIYDLYKNDPDLSSSRVRWILSRLYFHGYIKIQDKENAIENLLEEIIAEDKTTYYSFMAHGLLDRNSFLALRSPPPQKEFLENDVWINGFLEYGLKTEAHDYGKNIKNLDYSVATEIVKTLHTDELHLEALRFSGALNIPLNQETFDLYYILPYKDIILEVSSSYNLPPAMISGLLRTESGFDMHVVSRAGAIGLSQLMPATAKEMADSLRIKDPNLNDPYTNILLGGAYFNWLLPRFNNSFAISAMAYNGGFGNVRSWQAKWGELPDELFIEAAPFKETRDYFPKIVRAAIYYGYKEFDLTPNQVVNQLFKNIQ